MKYDLVKKRGKIRCTATILSSPSAGASCCRVNRRGSGTDGLMMRRKGETERRSRDSSVVKLVMSNTK